MAPFIMNNIKAPMPPIPLFFASKISAGFPSVATDCLDKTLDLNEHLIKNPPATFFLRATSEALRGAGIFAGDLLIVDRSIHPKSGDIVIVEIDGELSVRCYEKKGRRMTFSTDYSHIEGVHPSTIIDLTIWGVVTSAIHSL